MWWVLRKSGWQTSASCSSHVPLRIGRTYMIRVTVLKCLRNARAWHAHTTYPWELTRTLLLFWCRSVIQHERWNWYVKKINNTQQQQWYILQGMSDTANTRAADSSKREGVERGFEDQSINQSINPSCFVLHLCMVADGIILVYHDQDPVHWLNMLISKC